MALNVLLVDDSETVRSVIAKTLALAEVPVNAVHHASHGREALEVLQNNWIDLVFSDINMPEMGGIELIAAMKQDPAYAEIPVVVVSTEGSTTRIAELRAQGIKAYLRKPFTPEQLREAVQQVIGEIEHD